MHNLEGILFEDVVNEKGISYAAYRQSLKPVYVITWLHISAGLLSIILFCALAWYVEARFPYVFWLTVPFFSFITGFCIAYVNLFVHEAGHFYLHPDKRTNDLLANIFLCSWTGIDIKAYRKIHWHHHLHLATPGDTENSYFHPLNLSFILETFTGIHLLRVMMNKGNKQFLGKDLVKRSVTMLAVGMLINLAILFTAFYFGHWQFAVTWVLSMIIVFPFFAAMRQIIEHRDELASNERKFYSTPKNKISRIFSDSVASRLFGPAGFNKHMIHHWDPHLPFTALKKAEKFLMDCPRSRPILESSRTTYFIVFKKLFFNR